MSALASASRSNREQPRRGRFFVGARFEGEFCELGARRIGATERGVVLREIRDPGWGNG